VTDRTTRKLTRFRKNYGRWCTASEGRFYRKEITYFEEDGFVYWTMGALVEETTFINRCRKEDSFEARSKNGTLPETIAKLVESRLP
jgi:hypothetical protein